MSKPIRPSSKPSVRAHPSTKVRDEDVHPYTRPTASIQHHEMRSNPSLVHPSGTYHQPAFPSQPISSTPLPTRRVVPSSSRNGRRTQTLLHPVEAVVEEQEEEDAREVAQSPHLRTRRRSSHSEDDVDCTVAGRLSGVRWPNLQAAPAPRVQPRVQTRRRTRSAGRSSTRSTPSSSARTEPLPSWSPYWDWLCTYWVWVVVTLFVVMLLGWAHSLFRKVPPTT